MGLNANNIQMPKKESKFKPAEPLEADSYPARVVRVIDLGVQPQRPFKGQEKPPVHMVDLTYETVSEFLLDQEGNPDETKPRWFSEDFPFYSLEIERAKSTLRYNAIDPKGVAGGDFTQLVTMPCVVTLNQYKNKKGFTKNGVSTVTPVMKGMALPELVNEPKVFTLDDPDVDMFRSFPDWLQEKIKGNLNYKGSLLEGSLAAQPEKPKEEPKEEKQEPAKEEEPVVEQDDVEGDDAPW